MLFKRLWVVIFTILLLSILSSIFPPQVQAATISRTEILHAYLAKYNSPAVDNAADFIEAADKYSLDWRLVAAISGVESTFCKFVPGGLNEQFSSHNCWGWGVYGTQAIYFKSWRDGIYTVSQGLRENYLNKGLTNPYSINSAYAASPVWGSKVSYLLEDLNGFQEQYQKGSDQTVVNLAQAKVAGSSAVPQRSL